LFLAVLPVVCAGALVTLLAGAHTMEPGGHHPQAPMPHVGAYPS
jgi:hypothetical protein